MAKQQTKSNATEHSTYLRVSGEAVFDESITADGDFEVSFDRVATVALSPDAAEKLHSMLSERIPQLRRSATTGFA